MEGNNWSNRRDYNRDHRDYNDNHNEDRNRYQREDRPVDQDMYRGAYRLDNSSDHRNQSTYYGFDNQNNDIRSEEDVLRHRRQNINYNRNQQNNWSGDYRNNLDDRNNYNYDSGNNRREYRGGDNNRHWDEQYRPTSGGYGSRFGGDMLSNFDADYSPDNFRRDRDGNYGNMAGSLSWGYDGDRNSDPDYDRNFNPLTGEMRNQRDRYSDRRSERDRWSNRSNRNSDHNDRY